MKLVQLAALALAAGVASAAPPYPAAPPSDGWEFEAPGGITFIRKPNGMTIASTGGLFTQRRVSVTEPDGTVTRFVYPSAFHSPTSLQELDYARGFVEVRIPDERALLYVDDEPDPLRGAVLKLKTPLLEVGKSYTLPLRAAFRSGDELLIQDLAVVVPAGAVKVVKFDGVNAVRVPLPGQGEELPPPRVLPPPVPR